MALTDRLQAAVVNNDLPQEKKDAAARETFEELQKQREDWKDVLSEVDDLLKESEDVED